MIDLDASLSLVFLLLLLLLTLQNMTIELRNSVIHLANAGVEIDMHEEVFYW